MDENKKTPKIKINFDFKKNKNKIIIAGVVLSVVIIIIICLVVLGGKKEEKEQQKTTDEKIVATEETVEEEYGFSKEDAINSVKSLYNSDAYEFTATIREDNMYVVTVKNTETDTTHTYIVDPNDGSYQSVE